MNSDSRVNLPITVELTIGNHLGTFITLVRRVILSMHPDGYRTAFLLLINLVESGARPQPTAHKPLVNLWHLFTLHKSL